MVSVYGEFCDMSFIYLGCDVYVEPFMHLVPKTVPASGADTVQLEGTKLAPTFSGACVIDAQEIGAHAFNVVLQLLSTQFVRRIGVVDT
ncbi:hypothetical protein ACLOJK_025702 [Asimina triloba]